MSLNTCVYTFDIYLTFCSTDVDHENGQKETEMENVCNGVDIIENAEEEIEKLEGIPKKETCRLTRSMCLTPVNTKSLLVASGIM